MRHSTDTEGSDLDVTEDSNYDVTEISNYDDTDDETEVSDHFGYQTEESDDEFDFGRESDSTPYDDVQDPSPSRTSNGPTLFGLIEGAYNFITRNNPNQAQPLSASESDQSDSSESSSEYSSESDMEASEQAFPATNQFHVLFDPKTIQAASQLTVGGALQRYENEESSEDRSSDESEQESIESPATQPSLVELSTRLYPKERIEAVTTVLTQPERTLEENSSDEVDTGTRGSRPSTNHKVFNLRPLAKKKLFVAKKSVQTGDSTPAQKLDFEVPKFKRTTFSERVFEGPSFVDVKMHQAKLVAGLLFAQPKEQFTCGYRQNLNVYATQIGRAPIPGVNNVLDEAGIPLSAKEYVAFKNQILDERGKCLNDIDSIAYEIYIIDALEEERDRLMREYEQAKKLQVLTEDQHEQYKKEIASHQAGVNMHRMFYSVKCVTNQKYQRASMLEGDAPLPIQFEVELEQKYQALKEKLDKEALLQDHQHDSSEIESIRMGTFGK